MKHGQAGVAVILFVVLGLFMFYLLFVTPTERLSLLGLNEEEKNQTQPPQISESTNQIFSREIGYIGKKTGSLLREHELEAMDLAYPPVEEVIWEKGTAVLTANILFKGELSTLIPGDYAFVRVTGRIGDVIGTPVLKIGSNNIAIYSSEILRNQEINLAIDASKISGDALEISCEWHGLAFWKQQKCELLDLEIIKVSYALVNPQDTREVTITRSESQGGSYKLLFSIDSSNNTANLGVSVNGVLVYEEAPFARDEQYFIRGSLSSVDLSEGQNLIDFLVEPGASYALSDITLQTFEKESEESNITFYFNLSNTIYAGARNFTVVFSVEEITEAGGLDVIFNNKGYWFAPSQLVTGDNWLNVKREDLSAGANRVRISSSTGRFRIGTMRMYWE